jgi:hypothetical protein
MLENEIQKADPTLRTKTLWLTCVVFVVGFAANHFLVGYLDGAGDDLALLTTRARHAVYLFALATLPAIYFSIYLWRLARGTIAESRFPPSNTPVIKDTRIQQGSRARRRGYFLAAFAIILGTTFALLPTVMYFLLEAIIGTAT